MGVAEAFIEGVFGLIRLVVIVLLLGVAIHFIMQRMEGGWGRRRGALPALSPRRLWCKHAVAIYGRGTNGLVTYWCDACGKRAGRARRTC